jgi:hypothetical protein
MVIRVLLVGSGRYGVVGRTQFFLQSVLTFSKDTIIKQPKNIPLCDTITKFSFHMVS